MVKKIINN